MKKRNFITIFIGIVFILLICTFYLTNSKFENKKSLIEDESKKSDTLNEEDNVEERISKKKLNEIIEYMNSYDSVGFVKVTSEIKYYDDGTYDFSQQQYIISEVNLIEAKDNTIDYLSTSNMYEQKLKFEDVFGLSVRDYYEPFSLVRDIIEKHGFNIELVNASLNEELYKDTGQKSYVINNDSKILKQMVEDLDYDEILNSSCYFDITDTASKHSYINFVTAKLSYKKDDIRYDKFITIVIEVYNQDGSNPTDLY